MPRKMKILFHPRQREIIGEIIEGRPYRDIAGRYGVSRSAICRFVQGELAEVLGDADSRKRQELTERVVDNAVQSSLSLRRLLVATGSALTDPDDPEKYSADTQLADIEVLVPSADGKGPAERVALSDLLDRIEPAAEAPIEAVLLRRQDPRRVLLQISHAINRQLEYVTRVAEITRRG